MPHNRIYCYETLITLAGTSMRLGCYLNAAGLKIIVHTRKNPMKYLPIENRLFIENRQRFAAKLKPGSIAVLNSNDVMPKSADGTRSFVQHTDI